MVKARLHGMQTTKIWRHWQLAKKFNRLQTLGMSSSRIIVDEWLAWFE